jgi:hypothetical protein
MSFDPPDDPVELDLARFDKQQEIVEAVQELSRVRELCGSDEANGVRFQQQRVAVLRGELRAICRKLANLQSITQPKPEDPGNAAKVPTTRKPTKEPSANAFAAYRAVRFSDMKQEDVARKSGVKQSTISRWVRDVGKWVEAGNILPDELTAPPPRPKTTTMDPRKLEQGRRRPGRA